MVQQIKEKKSWLKIEINFGGVSLIQKAVFAKHLAIMLKAGLPITEALDIAQDSASGKFKKIIKEISGSVETGRSLSTSFARYPNVFSPFFINTTHTGELSGSLRESLENIAIQLEKEKNLAVKIKGAMLYPTIVLIAASILGIVLVFVILPKIVPLFKGLRVELPATTRALIAFSTIVQNYGSYFFFGLVSFIIFIGWLIKQEFSKPVTHWLLLNTPIVKNITYNAKLSEFSRTLGMLLKSGVNIDKALEISKDTIGNYYYCQALKKISQNISIGAKLSENLAQYDNLFPIMMTRMIEVGEESGNFEEILFYLSDFYEAEVDTATKALSAAIEPLLLVFIGSVVGFLAISIITPIYSITSGIK